MKCKHVNGKGNVSDRQRQRDKDMKTWRYKKLEKEEVIIWVFLWNCNIKPFKCEDYAYRPGAQNLNIVQVVGLPTLFCVCADKW